MGKSKLDRLLDQREENEALLGRVVHCISNSEECNGWEDDFLESVKDQLEEGRKMSEAQIDHIEKIEYLVEWGCDAYWEEFGRN